MYLSSLILPQRCISCSSVIPYQHVVCPKCCEEIEIYRQDIRPFLLPRMPVHRAMVGFRFISPGKVRSIVHAMKYGDRPQAGVELLGQFPEVTDPLLGWGIDCIVPIPQSPYKFWNRGYNQLSGMARFISNKIKAPVEQEILKRKSSGKSQASKDKSQREIGKYDFYTTTKYTEDRHILLIDDVLTTGKTLSEATLTLVQKGYRVSHWVMARDEK